MSYRMIILIAISAVVIYFSIAELVWQFRNRHFRRRLIIGVLIAALLVSQIDIINLFTKTDAEKVLAAAADADTDTSPESVEVSAIEKLSDGLKRHAEIVGTALDELMQPDTWKVVHVSADMDTAPVEETEVDENLLAEDRSGDTEEEILTETEKGTVAETPAEAEKSTEEKSPAETEKGTGEENPTEAENSIEAETPAEAEKSTEEKSPEEAENSTEAENPAEKENNTEESLKEDSMDNFAESEKSPDEAESAADAKTTTEADKQSGETSKGGISTLSSGGVILMANMEEHDSIKEWIAWDRDDSLPSSTGNYYLKKDVVGLSSTWEVNGTVNLCWNGHKHPESFQLKPGTDATLKFFDCNGTHNTYIIKYAPGEFGSGSVKSQTKTHGKPITLSTDTFTCEGYKQTGWRTEDEKNIYALGGIYEEDHDIILYPVWEANTYTVTYVKDGGTIDKESDYTKYTYGVGLTLPTPLKAGYIFEGWYEDSEFNGPEVKEITTTDTGNKTFYAKWSENLPTYTITYDPGKYGEGHVEPQTKVHGKDVNLSTETFTRPDYEQIGWAEKDGEALAYALGGSYTKDEPITLYPVWAAVYTITYEPGEKGEGQVVTQSKIEGRAIDLFPATFTRSGYIQTGWSKNDGGDKDYDLEGSYTEDSHITLYPVWTVTYTITYNRGGYGTGDIDAQIKIHGIAATLSTETFTREGHKQTGWATSDGGDKAYDLGGSYTKDEPITLYPVWAVVYQVTYKKNSGTIKNESNYTSYAHGEGLKLPTPTRPGYKFMGWYTDQNFKGSAVTKISATDEGDKTFYAKWEQISTEDNNDNGDSYNGSDPNSDDEDSSSDNGDTGSGNIGNKKPGKESDIDETDENLKDEASLEDADNSKDKRKEKEKNKKEDDTEDADDADDTDDSLDEQTERDADDDMKSSEGSKKSAGGAGTKSVNRTVQAGLKNGEIVIGGNFAGSDGTGVDGNGEGGEISGEESANTSIETGTIPGEESAATVLNVGEGSVIVTVVSDEWRYGAGVADTVAVANTVLTSEQKQLVNSGENIEIRIVVKDISEQVSKKDKAVIEDGLKADREEKSGKLVSAAYIDISVDIRTGDEDWRAITRTDKPIKVVVGISEEWSDDRTFYIARSHESEYALLEDLDSETDTVTIMTEFFSTYAIVYRQLPVVVIDADRISDFVTSHSWITTAGIGVALLYIGIMEILGIIAILLLGRQYKKEKEEAKKKNYRPRST